MLSFNKPITIGSGKWKLAPFRFYNKGETWSLGNGKVTPDWREITLSGVGALSLVNAKKDGLTALKLFGATEQNGTPSPDTPIDIVSNNGVVKVNTEASGKNAIDTSDTEQGYLTSTVGQQPNIRTSTVSVVIKRAIKVRNGKKYKFSYYSNVTGNRESNIVDNNGIVTLKSNLTCDRGLNEYIIEANTDGYLWVTVQFGDFATVKPTVYEIGQIYTDGTQETVSVHGKNLFDTQWQVGIYSPSTGKYSATNNRICNVNMIQVKPSTNYTVSFPDFTMGGTFRWVFYKSDKTFASAITNGNTTITTPANAEYLNVYIAADLTIAQAPDMQIEQGSTATNYEPYFNGGTANAPALFAVGDYKDEFILEN